tara:strand:- start:3568 stop:3783 length:216 start_codon:yes stop_codon:yes gene_type:complete
MSSTTIKVKRCEITRKVTSVVVNGKYEFKGDKKVYDANFINQEIKDYPLWLKEPQMVELIQRMFIEKKETK